MCEVKHLTHLLCYQMGCVMTIDNDLFFEAKSIKKNFGGVVALNDGCIGIKKGKICGLLGANGSGKTTLSRIITGIYKPNDGKLCMNGEPIHIDSPVDALEKGIVMVHQHLSLIPELSVWENICLGHENTKKMGFLDDEQAVEKADAALNRFGIDIPINEKVKKLSPAKKQIVEISKALSQNPSLLILDEPTSALEQEEVASLFKVVTSLRKENVSIVFTSHRMWEVLEICDYVTVFRNGNFVGEVDFEKDGKDEKKIVELITGVSQNKATSIKNKADGPVFDSKYEPLIELESLVIPGFDKRDNNGVSMKLHPGEIVGISGLQGQGQEDLLLLLSGYFQPVSGVMKFQNISKRYKHPLDAIREGIVLVPGDRNEEGLFVHHDLNFNINYPYLVSKSVKSYVSKEKNKKRAKSIIDKMSIHPPEDSMIVENLSGGNQQKIVIGKWLELNPKVLLLSDPAKGVDVRAKDELYSIVLELAKNGTAVILYASDNKELISICNKIFVMFEGGVVESLSGEEIKDENLTAHSLRARYIAAEKD